MKVERDKSAARRCGDLDSFIGARLRELRIACGVSQTKLAKQLDITFQQVQKYESGTNRISASRLFEASFILGVPITFFFVGYDFADSSQINN